MRAGPQDGSDRVRRATITATPTEAPAVGQRARRTATVDAPIPLDGLTARVALPAPPDGCVGVIVVNRAGAGTYTVTRS